MIYLKSALVGIFTAVVAIAIVTFALLRVSLGEGSGAASLSIAEWQILVAGVTGFGVGFWATLRHSRTPHRT